MTINEDFIVISDFHGIYEVFSKLKYNYISKYDNIYILGDATDRGYDGNGGGGVKLLLKIMDLEKKIKSLPQNVRDRHHIGCIHYIPGNHDDFLYEYALLQDENAKINLEGNHGSQTIKDIDDMRAKKPERLEELTDWLGNKPLQMKHKGRDGKVYCLAHAFFNEYLYNLDKDFSLSDYLYIKTIYNYLFKVFWFRKDSDSYLPRHVPSSDNIGVIGHTPSMFNPNTRKFDLESSDGKIFKVMNVDGGLAYGGDMLEYSGGDSIKKANLFNNEELEQIKKKKYPYYSIDDIFDNYLNKNENTQPKIDFNEYVNSLTKIWNNCHLLLKKKTNDFGDNLLDMLYQTTMKDEEFQKLHLSYSNFCKIIIYNHVFIILSDMYNIISNEEKVLNDFNNWIKTSHMAYGYSELLYILTSKISVDTIIEYLSGNNDLKDLLNYAKASVNDYSKILLMKKYKLPILLPKDFIESFNNNNNINSYKKS